MVRFLNPETYPLPQGVNSGILPPCPHVLPALQVLHMSGNGITGSLPQQMILAPALNDLSFSHNILTGSIPTTIQYQSTWTSLDLSFNKLSGTLHSNMKMSENATVLMNVNRLSSSIPFALINLEKISILEGNMFSCATIAALDSRDYRNGLPIHDSAQSRYQCGSNVTNILLYSWIGILCILVFVYVMIRIRLKYRCCNLQSDESTNHQMNASDDIIMISESPMKANEVQSTSNSTIQKPTKKSTTLQLHSSPLYC
jgi:hypothetical protein